MFQPMTVTHQNELSKEIAAQDSSSANQVDDELEFGDSWLESNLHPAIFDREYLRQGVAQARNTQRTLTFEWRAINRGAMTRMGYLSTGDVALSLFCLTLSVWIMVIWQSDAPFWWVPGLALFFGIAAVAALHDAIWSTPQSRRAQFRRQLRQSQRQVKCLSNRLAMVEFQQTTEIHL